MQSNPDVEKYLFNKFSFDDIEWVCTTCYKQLSKNRVPPCAIANGTVFPNKPPFFDLNELECRLLAPRIAFQKLMQAPRGKQLKIHGNVVNVPADVVNTVSMLPRLPSETGTVEVNLKRKLQLEYFLARKDLKMSTLWLRFTIVISVNLNSEDQIEEQLCVSRIYSIKLKSYK